MLPFYSKARLGRQPLAFSETLLVRSTTTTTSLRSTTRLRSGRWSSLSTARPGCFSELGALEGGMHACFWFVYLVSCGHGTKAAGRLLQPCPCMRIEKQLHFAQPYI